MPAIVRTRPKRPKPPKPPQSDPKFARVSRQLNAGAAKVKQHPAPAKKAAEAQAAAKGPPDEKLAGAKANQADVMKQAEPQEPDPNSFEAALLAEIDKLVPETLDEADKFMEGGESEQLKSNVEGGIKEQKDSAAGDMEAATEKAPDPGGVPAKSVTPLPSEPAAQAPPVNGGEAMPAPKPADEVSQEQTKLDAKTALDKEKLTPKRLTAANDPRFSAVLKEKAKVDKVADAAPAKYRAGEKAALGNAVAKAQGEAKQGAAALAAEKNKSGKGVTAQQKAAQERDEKRRAEVTGRITAIFDRTKSSVDRILKGLESAALSEFDRGSSAALVRMRVNSDREIEAFKKERYSGATGKAAWVADLFRPAPPELKQIIQANLKAFSAEMKALARTVARKVDAKLKQAQGEIAKGQAEIAKYVESLPKDLKEFGKAAEAKVGGEFDQLKKGIDDRKNALASKLAERYKAAQDAANAMAAQLEKENEGAFAGFAEAVGGVIKILLEFKDKLMAILRKGADTIELILADPIGFLGNLIAAIKAGVSGFVANIWAHLKAGFMKWLFGALGGAGIPIPADLSLPSIFKMVMAVLGITYERMRAKAVKILGPTAVAVIEKLVEYVRTLIAGGPAALWAQIKGDLSNLKAMVIDEIQSWLVTTIIKAAVVKLLSMFNPAGAIVQAVMAIYNTVMFLVERAAQIMEFVNAVINSVHAIATGAIGGAAAWIERALANAIPIVIGFLAALIGLGGISAKIRSIIQKVQAKVDAAIDKALARIVATFKKLFGKLIDKLTGKGKKDKKDKDKKDKDKKDKDKKDKDGKQYPTFKIDKGFAMSGTGHHLYAEVKDGRMVIEMASRRAALRALASAAMGKTDNPKAKKRIGNVLSKLDDADRIAVPISDKAADEAARQKAEKMASDAANTLMMIGNEFGIPDLLRPPHASNFVKTDVDAYRVKPPHDKKIRDTFYPSGYEPATRTWFRNRLKALENPANKSQFKDEMTNQWEPKNTATIDHTTRVVEHWKGGGNNATQGARKTFYNDFSGGKLRAAARKNNSSDGAQARIMGLVYTPEVGEKFRGPGE